MLQSTIMRSLFHLCFAVFVTSLASLTLATPVSPPTDRSSAQEVLQFADIQKDEKLGGEGGEENEGESDVRMDMPEQMPQTGAVASNSRPGVGGGARTGASGQGSDAAFKKALDVVSGNRATGGPPKSGVNTKRTPPPTPKPKPAPTEAPPADEQQPVTESTSETSGNDTSSEESSDDMPNTGKDESLGNEEEKKEKAEKTVDKESEGKSKKSENKMTESDSNEKSGTETVDGSGTEKPAEEEEEEEED